MKTNFKYDDGGRKEAGFKGHVGDCVCRAIAIATETPYIEVYKELHQRGKDMKGYSRAAKAVRRNPSPRSGVSRLVYQKYLEDLGWVWIPCMKIGTGTQVHVDADELPSGRLILRVSKHVTCMVDGVLHDTYDCSREGRRAVYGYFKKLES